MQENNADFEALITNVPDFPKAGVIFKDISPLLQENFDEVITEMGKGINWDEIDTIIGIEARGFILGAAMAIKFKKGFLPMRKKGKLPPPVIGEEYSLEYGTDKLELRVNDTPRNVVLVDDVLATGGTLKAAMSLCQKNKYTIKAISMLINLKFLNKLDEEFDYIHSVLNYE
jgi:adenine phosphoribosyltransferase